MNSPQLLKSISAGLMLSAAVVATLEYLEVRKEERAKRDAIEAKRQREIAALDVALARILKSLDTRTYERSPEGIARLESDFEFETIRAYNGM